MNDITDIEILEDILTEKIDVSKILYCEKTNDLLFTKSQYLNDMYFMKIFLNSKVII